MSWVSKRVTTVKEYDAYGNVVKTVETTEYVYPTTWTTKTPGGWITTTKPTYTINTGTWWPTTNDGENE
jgi:hypothetical protein